MREVVTMWRHTKMVVLVALTAAVYAAILIPLKGIPLIPGFTEIRPANVVPVVFSLLFGPAGAWGSAFGNLIGDFFGTLGLGSIFGFVGNFFYGLVPYKLWGKKDSLSSRQALEILSGRAREFLRLFVVLFFPLITLVAVALLLHFAAAFGFRIPNLLAQDISLSTIAAAVLCIALVRLGVRLARIVVPAFVYCVAYVLLVQLAFGFLPRQEDGVSIIGLFIILLAFLVSLVVLLGRDVIKLIASRQFWVFVVQFIFPAFLASASCAVIISWGVDLFGLVPFAVLAPIITLNNFIAAAILGPFLLGLMYSRAERWDILWTDIMEPYEISASKHPWIGAVLMWVGGIGGLAVGVAISTGLHAALPFKFGTGTTGLGVVAAVFPFLLLIVLGCLLA